MKLQRGKTKPVDRRIQKTKTLLSEALVSLIIEKGYADVSIKDIIDRANVGRSTFYAHFESKEQLLLSGHDTFQRLLNERVGAKSKGQNGVDINFLFLYEHVQSQRKLTRALVGKSGGELVQHQLHHIFEERIAQYFKQQAESDPVMFSLIVKAAASAMVALLVEWMEREMPFPPAVMAERAELLLLKMMK
ncbi:MAG TPA: TetR/AcrR family transcriptional regulator [Bacteroidota bacterium]|nr:TetR/AcrR family transcriptional regulator [Bacteroidota bacterium]